jgi:hypothetical protein
MRHYLLVTTSALALSIVAGRTWASPSPMTYDTPGSYTYTVPVTGTYMIEAIGAKGGLEHWTFHPDAIGGNGADITGRFSLSQNEQLAILVGQVGTNGPEHAYGAAGGGGGTFVVGPGNTPLLIAGGGGGGGAGYGKDGGNAVDDPVGSTGNGMGGGAGGQAQAGGAGGNPGDSQAGYPVFGGAGGGGLIGSGTYGVGHPTNGYTVPLGGSDQPPRGDPGEKLVEHGWWWLG